MTSVGAIFSPYPNAPEALIDAAVAAERAGVRELWIWEDCFRHGAFSAASAALAVTSELKVGIGIAPMPLRNVTATAMEIATIARLFPGRLLPGIGHGVQSWMAQTGSRVASPLTLMREYAPALRALLAGETVTTTGRYVTLDAVRLDFAPADVPLVYAAAEGPKTLAACGAAADGVVLNSLLTVEEAADGIARVNAGRADAGRAGRHDVAGYVVAAFGPHAAERAASVWSDETPPDASDRVLAGTVEQVASGVRRYADVGVDRVVLLPPADEPDLAAYFEQVSAVARLVG